MFITTVVNFYIENKSDYGLYKSLSFFHITYRDQLAYQAVKSVSKDAILYASPKYIVPFSSRNEIRVFYDFNPGVISYGDYFLIDLIGGIRETDQSEKQYQKLDKEKIVSEFLISNQDLLNNNHLSLIFNQDGILLFRK